MTMAVQVRVRGCPAVVTGGVVRVTTGGGKAGGRGKDVKLSPFDPRGHSSHIEEH